jgi:hypothetical protein
VEDQKRNACNYFVSCAVVLSGAHAEPGDEQASAHVALASIL